MSARIWLVERSAKQEGKHACRVQRYAAFADSKEEALTLVRAEWAAQVADAPWEHSIEWNVEEYGEPRDRVVSLGEVFR